MVRTRDQYKWIVRGDLDTWTVITSIDVDHRLWPKFSEKEQNYLPTHRPGFSNLAVVFFSIWYFVSSVFDADLSWRDFRLAVAGVERGDGFDC